MLLPIGTTVHRLIGVMGFQKFVPVFRYGILSTALIYVLSLAKPKTGIWVMRIFMAAILIFAVFLSVKEIYFFNIDKWYWAD